MKDLNGYLRKKKQTCEEMAYFEPHLKNQNQKILICPESTSLSRGALTQLNNKLGQKFFFMIYMIKGGMCRINAIRKKCDSFEIICPINMEWAGLSDIELQKKSGIQTATFVHVSGFVGGTKTLEDAMTMCNISIDKYMKEQNRK